MSLFLGLENIDDVTTNTLTDVDQLNISEITDTEVSTEVYASTEATSYDKVMNAKMGAIGDKQQPMHQIKIKLQEDGSKYIEIYLYGDLDYYTKNQQLRTLFTIIESCSEKDTLHLHTGIEWYPMVTQSYLAYVSTISDCQAHTIIQTTNIRSMLDLALCLSADEIRVSSSAYCAFKDMTDATFGTFADKEAMNVFINEHREVIKDKIISSGFMTNEEWDTILMKNKVFSSVGDDLVNRFNQPETDTENEPPEIDEPNEIEDD